MAVNSETEINLKTLQRVDSNIIEIIDNASQVAIYKFERKLNKWEGTDIEGTLFLYRRNLYPFHGFIIVNRMSTTNFVEDITSDMEFLLQEPYFLYKKSCGEIIGSWFYEECDFRRITNKIQSIVLKQVTTPKRQRCSSDSDSQLKKDDSVQDIMSMLSDAHTEYIKREINEESQGNVQENFNDMSTYSDKKIKNKSVNAWDEKSNSSLRASSEEKYPVSPRRRFLSTGSYDPNHFLPLTSNKILNELTSCSNEATTHRREEDQSSNKFHLLNNVRHFAPIENVKSPSPSSRLSPLFSHSGEAKPVLSGVNIQNQAVEPFDVPFNSYLKNLEIQTTSGDYVFKLEDEFPNASYKAAHSLNLKKTLISHLEWNSDILLKIHEAYVARLKSLFIPKKS